MSFTCTEENYETTTEESSESDDDFEVTKSKKRPVAKKAESKVPVKKAKIELNITSKPKMTVAQAECAIITKDEDKEKENIISKSPTISKHKVPAVSSSEKKTLTNNHLQSKAVHSPPPPIFISEKEAENMIITHITDENKPFNLNTLYENLNRLIKLASIKRIIEKLESQDKVKVKSFNKIQIYFVNQENFPSLNDEQLITMERDIEDLKDRELERREELKVIEVGYKKVENVLLVSDLKEKLLHVRNRCESLQRQLDIMGQNNSNNVLVSDKERDEMKKKLFNYSKIYKVRKNAVKEMLGNLSEASEKKVKDLVKDMEIDVDENYPEDLKILNLKIK